MQPFARSALCDLVNEHIDYLSAFQIAGQREPELRWCQGGVIAVLDRKKPTVRVLWDEMPDCTGWETLQETTDVILLPTEWNKNKEGAWRMDLPVVIEDTYDDGGEDEINKSDPKVETRDYESESS